MLLEYLINNKEEMKRIKEFEKIVAEENTWEVRAKKVINDLL